MIDILLFYLSYCTKESRFCVLKLERNSSLPARICRRIRDSTTVHAHPVLTAAVANKSVEPLAVYTADATLAVVSDDSKQYWSGLVIIDQ